LTVLAPLLLLAGLSLAVPLFLHFRQKVEVEPESFPALRYLLSPAQEPNRIRRVRRWLLLASRLLLLALLTLAAARWVLPIGKGDQPPGALVVIVDNGMSSGRIVGNEQALDRLLTQARGAVAAAGPLDRIWVLPAGEPWRSSFPLSPQEADSVLQTLRPSAASPRWTTTLQRADALLAAAGSRSTQILLFSELRTPPIPAPLRLEAPLVVAWDPVSPSEGQRGIAQVRVGGGLPPRAGDPSEVEVGLEGEETGGVAVRLFLGDSLVAVGRTGDRGRVLLPLPPLPSGRWTGSVEIDRDALRLDDEVPFDLDVRPAPRVALPTPPIPFVSEGLGALEAGGRIRLVPGGSAQVQILDFAASGEPGLDLSSEPGSLWILLPPRDPSRIPALNRWLNESGVPWTARPRPGDDRVVRRLAGPGFGFSPALEGIEVFWSVEWEGPEDEIRLRLSDGAPWMVESLTSGGVRVRVLASPLDVNSTALPTSVAMLGFLDRLVEDPGTPRRSAPLEVGDGIPLPSGTRQVQAPDGSRWSTQGLSRFWATDQPGVWTLLQEGGEPLEQMAVRPALPPPPPLNPETFVAPLDADLRLLQLPARWDPEVLPDRRGREMSPLLSWMALLLLGLEGWLAAAGRPRRPALPVTGSP